MRRRLTEAFLIAITAHLTLTSWSAEALRLSPVYITQSLDGREELMIKSKSPTAEPAFYAVCTNDWVSGLVPLFAVEKGNNMELRRRPPRGQENFSEPLFFALPCEDETNVSKITGRWECRATRPDSGRSFLAFELGAERDDIFGRFDQNTDYRFAFITGGSFRSNALELRVEYIKEAYVLTGKWTSGKLRGTWERTDKSEDGAWEAERQNEPRFSRSQTIAALCEWRRASDGAQRCALDGEKLPAPWEKTAKPLCRVWLNSN